MGCMCASGAEPLQPFRMVSYWTPAHVYVWLTKWGVPTNVAGALYLAGIDGPKLVDLFYAYEYRDPGPWTRCGVVVDEGSKSAIYEACKYLTACSWVISEWVSILFLFFCFSGFFIFF